MQNLTKLSNKNVVFSCGMCKQVGHNARTCKSQGKRIVQRSKNMKGKVTMEGMGILGRSETNTGQRA